MKHRHTLARPGVSVETVAPARLHLGFLDLHGGLGRRFGSLGLAIDAFATRLSARPARTLEVSGPEAERALEYARVFAAARGLPGGAQIEIRESIPRHSGLGSGTQLALAVGSALERLYADSDAGRSADSRTVAGILGRGLRSGIGIGAFEQGGFVVDCGRGALDAVPPIALRIPFPERWRILLILDQRGLGLHGERERQAFAGLPEFPESTADRLCRVLLMQIVPGLLEQRLDPVAAGIREIQRAAGEYFAPAQGGCFASPAVAAALEHADRSGLVGNGQSSWGPTGFVLTADEDSARGLKQSLQTRFGELSPLRYRICAARNRGAELTATPASAIDRTVQLAQTHAL